MANNAMGIVSSQTVFVVVYSLFASPIWGKLVYWTFSAWCMFPSQFAFDTGAMESVLGFPLKAHPLCKTARMLALNHRFLRMIAFLSRMCILGNISMPMNRRGLVVTSISQ